MKDKKCNGNCCNSFFESYNEDEDDYEIQRLEDIIEICEFLIKVKKHRKEKREAFNKVFEEAEEKEKNTKFYTNTRPFYVYKYPFKISDWDKMWF